MAEKKQVDYQSLSQELETILAALQQDDVDIDTAVEQYGRGLEVVKQLEEYLKAAENRVTKLKSQHAGGK